MPTRQTQRTSRRESRARIVAAANELVRRRSYPELSVGELMREAGLGRTIFYRHFDDLGDLLVGASRDAIDELYAAQRPPGTGDARAARRGVRAGAGRA